MIVLIKKFRKELLILIAIATACLTIPIGIGMAALLFKSSTFSVTHKDTQINIGATQKAANNTQYAVVTLQERLNQLEGLIYSINAPEVEPLKESFENEFKPTAKEVIKSTEELAEAIETSN